MNPSPLNCTCIRGCTTPAADAGRSTRTLAGWPTNKFVAGISRMSWAGGGAAAMLATRSPAAGTAMGLPETFTMN